MEEVKDKQTKYRQNSVFRAGAVGEKEGRTSITWIVQVPFVPCPRILQSFDHKELIVVFGVFMVWCVEGSDFTLCWVETSRFSLYFQSTALLKSHLNSQRLSRALIHPLFSQNLLLLCVRVWLTWIRKHPKRNLIYCGWKCCFRWSRHDRTQTKYPKNLKC